MSDQASPGSNERRPIRGRKRSASVALICALFGVFGLLLSGCGSDDAQQEKAKFKLPDNPKRGGSITFLASGDVDSLDPGQMYYQFTYMIQSAVNRTLFSYNPLEPNEPTPDIAKKPAWVSADGLTVTAQLRSGVFFSPPVNREVKSKDIKYAIERAFSAPVASGYANNYFGDLVGAPTKPTNYAPNIKGIETPDDRTIVFHLTKPTGIILAAALVMPITTPVPREYAERFDRSDPSTYAQNVVFTGPYMVKANKKGRLIGWQPMTQIELVRNPNWDPETDFRPAYLDSITVREGFTDPTIAAKEALNGSATLCCDSGAPPTQILRQALQQNKSQVARIPSGNTRWVALNTKIKPFNNLNLRKAIFAAFNRSELRLSRGGAAIGPVAQHFIPTSIPGFKESGGAKGFKKLDFTQIPNGDMKPNGKLGPTAMRYMMAAKKDGVPINSQGKYTGKTQMMMVAANTDPASVTAQTALQIFQNLGFSKVKFIETTQQTLYTKFCGSPSAHIAICPNVAWSKDFPDPQAMLQPTFSGKAIKSVGNVNWSQLNIPKINRAMVAASTLPVGPKRDKAWAKINYLVTSQAPGIPFVWDDSFQLQSKDVHGVANPYFQYWDLSFTSLKHP